MKIITMLVGKKEFSKGKIVKFIFVILFVIYVLLFLTLTLFNRLNMSCFNWNKDIFSNYVSNSFNVIPFKTIISYFKAVFKGNISIKLFLYNIFGNFFALMPFALFLPFIFKKQNKFYIFLLTILIVVISVEALQFVSRTGSCDIDDFILNVFRCMYNVWLTTY